MSNIIIHDETLRDGEQQVGVFFSTDEKKELVRRMVKAGIQRISLMPTIHDYEMELTKELTSDPSLKDHIYASTMNRRLDIDAAIESGVAGTVIFDGVSDILLGIRFPNIKDPYKRREELKRITADNCKYSSSKGLITVFAAMDATRADEDFLVELLREIAPYIDTFKVCDTIGIADPPKIESITSKLVNSESSLISRIFRKPDSLKIGIHCHNNLGYAVENTCAAVKGGARVISVTSTGIGEGAGNASTTHVLYRLEKSGVGLPKGIDPQELFTIDRLVYEYGGSRPPRILSPEIFNVESGTHVHGLMRNIRSYNLIDPKTMGLKFNRVFYGKWSGRSNYEYLFKEELANGEIERGELEVLRDRVKELSYLYGRSFDGAEIRDWYFKDKEPELKPPEREKIIKQYFIHW
jgi:isopropylmalate/homocitrate/citramalate synthase